MRKFLQWSLVATIAIALLLGITYQLLTSITAHKKDESVAAFKEQLRQAEEKVAISAESSRPQIQVQEVPVPAPPPSANLKSLRKRWLALFAELDNPEALCGYTEALYGAANRTVFQPEEAQWTEGERKQLTAFLDCTAEITSELLFLCREDTRPAVLNAPEFQYMSSDVLQGFYRATTILRLHLMAKYLEGDYTSTIDATCALINLAETRLFHPDGWNKYPTWMWPLVNAGIANKGVDDRHWNRLLKELEEMRSDERYAGRTRSASQFYLADYEDYPFHFSEISSSQYPISYAQNWAYRHVTTPLFNHDVDRFCRAMQVLTELASVPYYRAKPDLDQFYIDFDVEPSPDEIRFMRGNSLWHFVLYLSREGLKDHAAYQAHIDVVRIAILLDQYHQATNTYPETLEAIADKLGGEVPINPLSGTPYVYERKGEVYLLGLHYA